MSFKDDYNKAKVNKDMDDAIEKWLSREDRKELIEAMEVVNRQTGLDMRQEHLLMVLTAMERVESRRRWAIWAMRSSLSQFGSAESWAKSQGKVMLFDSAREATEEAMRLNASTTANVSYTVKEYY